MSCATQYFLLPFFSLYINTGHAYYAAPVRFFTSLSRPSFSPLMSCFWSPIAIFSSFHNSTYLAKGVAAYLAGKHVGEGINKRLAGLRHLRLGILRVVLGEYMEHLPSVGAKGTRVRGGDAATGAHWERFDRESGQWYTAVHV